MPNERKILLLMYSGRRLPAWLRIWLTVAALVASAVLFWFGLLLALAVLLATFVVLLPVWAWRSFQADRRPVRPATIDGEYTIIAPFAVDSMDATQGEITARDAGRP